MKEALCGDAESLAELAVVLDLGGSKESTERPSSGSGTPTVELGVRGLRSR